MNAGKKNNKRSKSAADHRQSGGEGGHGGSLPVVGIGASAGGLEAFTALLKALPTELGMAFVLVPHLDPSRESAFTQILSRTTTMPVVEISNGMPVKPNRVFIIPPNCELTISQGVLHIGDREETHIGNTTIDIFMRSLARDQGSNAVGVILSGTGMDGTAGLAAIKGEGGITFAQEPESAKYNGMPVSAIASGGVDFVLPPQGIAHELARISRHPHLSAPELELIEREETEGESHMSQVFRLLRRATKVDFSEYKPPTIGRRVKRRMVLHRMDKLADYVSLLHRDRGEVNALYQDLLINVTSFFRNQEAFESLKHIVYPAILHTRMSSSAPIRIWVPGCSTGEEPYSHAISLVEFLSDERTEVPVQIFGTDLSEIAVQRARAGMYKESIEADVSATRLRRFFHKSDGGYQISKAIRDLCIFSTQNVFSDPPFSRMDLVSCRNVMIYLSQTLQKRVIPIFHYALNPTGFLMIGSTEGLLGAGSELFEIADKRQKIYRKKLVSTPVAFGFSVSHAEKEIALSVTPTPPAKVPDTQKAPLELQREADRLLLARYAPPAVVVNDQLEIIQSRGRTGTFLELPPGKASLNLLKMARPGLLFELQSAIDEARKSAVEARREDVRVEGNGTPKLTTLRVNLIVFEEVIPEQEGRTDASAAPLTDVERSDRDRQIAQLTQELAATKEYLQSIIETQEATNEELQSANEEIQSGNEELQSTNEELQTSKEELESANEELHTVNEEMQHRNELLTQLNNDLTNLVSSISLPMVMLGGDLSVRRFSPQAANVLGLMASDVGRLLPRLQLKVNAHNLELMMLDVMRETQPKQQQVRDRDGNLNTIRITPYRTMDNRIDGVVLVVVDSRAFEEFPENGDEESAKRTAKKSKATDRQKPRSGLA